MESAPRLRLEKVTEFFNRTYGIEVPGKCRPEKPKNVFLVFEGSAHKVWKSPFIDDNHKFARGNRPCIWSSSPDPLEFRGSSSATFSMEKDKIAGLRGGDRLCLYMMKTEASGQETWSCIEKKYTGSTIKLVKREIERGIQQCPWNKPVSLRIEIVLKATGHQISAKEYRFVLPPKLAGKPINQETHTIEVISGKWATSTEKIKRELVTALSRYFDIAGIQLDDAQKKVKVEIDLKNYVKLSSLKFQFRFPDGGSTRDCDARLEIPGGVQLGQVSPRDIKVQVHTSPNTTKGLFYDVADKYRDIYVSLHKPIKLRLTPTDECQARSNVREISAADIRLGTIRIELTARKPVLVVVMEPIDDVALAVTGRYSDAAKKRQKPWQADLEDVWNLFLDEIVKDLSMNSDGAWSRVLYWRRKSDERERNVWHPEPRPIDRRTDLVNELVNDIPVAENSLSYNALLKEMRKSGASNAFILLVGVPYRRQTGTRINACERYDIELKEALASGTANHRVFMLAFGNSSMLNRDIPEGPKGKSCSRNRCEWELQPIELKGTQDDGQLKAARNTIFACTKGDEQSGLPVVVAKLPHAGSRRYGAKAFAEIRRRIHLNLKKKLDDWKRKAAGVKKQ